MIAVVAWWLASTAIGWAAFPLAWRLFPALRDRGFGLARAFGLLGASYAFWLLTSAGVLRNDLGGAWGGVLILAASAALSLRGVREELRAWLRAHVRLVLTMEALFLGAYLLWCLVRSTNPEIVATEKPMELMFLNSILRSPQFPPHDGWLSGYAISYYYFGYIQAALLTRLTGVFSGIAFNLTNALWFALTALGAASVAYNLLPDRLVGKGLGRAWWAPLIVLLAGNLEAFLDVLHSRHLFWSTAPDGTMTSAFWRALGIKELVDPPLGAAAWVPERFWWWWRASRVVHDANLLGADIEVIDEFPFFSFLLADNHPHLLALPFVLLGIGFALQVFLAPRTGENRILSAPPGFRQAGMWLAAGAVLVAAAALSVRPGMADAGGSLTPALHFAAIVLIGGPLAVGLIYFILGGWSSSLTSGEFWLAAFLLGGLAFLNTWDFPIALALLAMVMAWRLRGRGWDGLIAAARTAIGVAGVGFLLYAFWYVGFSSQAGGILPNLLFPTAFPQFFVMFAPAVVPIAYWLVREFLAGRRAGEWIWLLGIGLGLPIALFVFSLLVGVRSQSVLAARGELEGVLLGLGAANTAAFWAGVWARWQASPWTALFLGALIGMCAVLLRRWARAEDREGSSREAFIVLLIGLGALLVLTPEFVYLRDSFATRMNTVFKFYFAAWILWGFAAAWVVADALRGGWFRARNLIILPLALGMIYPVLATWTKANGFAPADGSTLDGTAHLLKENPGDAAAIVWMNANLTPGVVAEAVGGSYTGGGRVAVHTGFPTVLGWTFHEVQWRGGVEEMGSRETDIQTLYETRDWDEAQVILAKYDIDYVVVGSLEHETYPPIFTAKFDAYLDILYQAEGVTIYAVPLLEREGP